METLTEEVVSESSENSAENSLTQGEGNLTMAELASSLMQKRQNEDTETTTEEESEPVAEESTEEEESEDQSAEVPEESDEESDEQPVQPSENVLSKFKDLDLDSLSEEESKELAKHLNASAIKRFGKLTAQKKALQHCHEDASLLCAVT